VAAFGDSLMWGQGLRRSDRFSELITRELAKRQAKTAKLVFDDSRSGAKIRASQPEYVDFVDTNPSLFAAGTAIRVDVQARELYGEVPSTFPQISVQLNLMSAAEGRKVDLVLLDGGVNDVEIEDIINPQVEPGRWIEHFDGHIRVVGHDDVLDLISLARRRCPNALILYFGYCAPVSYRSNVRQIRAFFRQEYGDEFKWWFNEHVIEVEDIDRLILEGMVRSLWFQGRWQYWTSKAVDDANHDETVRGPGVLYVPSGFTAENAAFTPTPFVWDDPFDPSSDDARDTRVKEIPRVKLLSELSRFAATVGTNPSMAPGLASLLEPKMDGPTLLKKQLKQIAGGDLGLVGKARAGVVDEISRIHFALIASSFHPNADGAKQYSLSALNRIDDFDASKKRLQAELKRPAGTGETIEQLLTRCGLRGNGPLTEDLGRLNVDSIALEVITALDSGPNLAPDVFLIVSTKDAKGKQGSRSYRLNFKYTTTATPSVALYLLKVYQQFEPGSIDRFTIDPLLVADPAKSPGMLRLEEITGCSLLLGGDPFGAIRSRGAGAKRFSASWTPAQASLEINGVRVADVRISGLTLGPGDRVDLGWPAPQPTFVPPKLAQVRLAKARPFRIAATKERGAGAGGGTVVA
jgi:hypothetical protein